MMGFTKTEARATGMVLVATLLVSQIAAQSITGTVKDEETGAAIIDASVILMDDDGRIQRGTLSESDGSFVLEAPAAGRYVVRIGAAGYLTKDTPELRLRAGQAEQMDIALVPESASGPPAGFYERLNRGEGEFITREEIEERAFTLFTDLLQFTPAVRVVPLPASSQMNAPVDEVALLPVLTRRSSTESARERQEAARGGRADLSTIRIKAGRDFKQRVAGAIQQGEPADECIPVLWVDGIWWGGIDGASPTGPDGAFVPADIDGIEIYNHPSILPEQFNSGRDALCGVVVVWTRRKQ
jgi:hypothetical protein